MMKCSGRSSTTGTVLEQRRQRRIGGHAVVQSVGAEADVMAAGDAGLAAFAEVRRWAAAAGASVGRPATGSTARTNIIGPEHAPARAESRREIEDAHHAAVRVVQPRFEDGGVAQVGLLGAREIEHVDRRTRPCPNHRPPSAAARRTPGRRRAAAGRPRPCAPARRSAPPPGNCRSLRSSRGHRQSVCSASCSSQRCTAAGPGSHHSDFTRGPDRDREPVEAPHRRESAVIGLVVADEDRHAPGERRFLHEGRRPRCPWCARPVSPRCTAWPSSSANSGTSGAASSATSARNWCSSSRAP